jgi:hypothetical protein
VAPTPSQRSRRSHNTSSSHSVPSAAHSSPADTRKRPHPMNNSKDGSKIRCSHQRKDPYPMKPISDTVQTLTATLSSPSCSSCSPSNPSRWPLVRKGALYKKTEGQDKRQRQSGSWQSACLYKKLKMLTVRKKNRQVPRILTVLRAELGCYFREFSKNLRHDQNFAEIRSVMKAVAL